MDYNHLFSQGRLYDFLEKRMNRAIETSTKISSKELNDEDTDIISSIIGRFKPSLINIQWDDISAGKYFEGKENFRDFGIDGVRDVRKIVLTIPFEGHAELFDLRPNQFSGSGCIFRTEVNPKSIDICVSDVNLDNAIVNATIQNFKDTVEKYLLWQENDIEAWENNLKNRLAASIQQRRVALSELAELQDNLKIELH